jgi:hypothetical protein
MKQASKTMCGQFSEIRSGRVQFVEGGRKQIIEWEWKPAGVWLPLCDGTAVETR